MSTPEHPSSPPPAVASASVSASASNVHLIAPVGILIAGLLGVIGGVLPWVTTSISAGEITQSIQGPSPVDGSSGPGRDAAIAVLLGVLLLIVAALYLFGRRNRRLVEVTGGLSVLLLGFGIFEIIQVYRRANDFYDRLDATMASAPAEFRAGMPDFRHVFHIDPAPGLWMVAVAGLLGTVLSVVVLLSRRTVPAAAVAPAAVEGPTVEAPTPTASPPTPALPLDAPMRPAAPPEEG